MYLFLSLFGILVSILLLFQGSKKYTATIYLSLFFLTVSIYGLNSYAVLHSGSVLLVAIFFVTLTSLAYLPGPLLYWYIRSVISDNASLQKNDIWHLLPIAIYLVASVPYLLTPFEYKMEIARQIVADPGFLSEYNATILSKLFSNSFLYIGRPVLVMIYTLYSTSLFTSYLLDKEVAVVFSRQKFMMKWIFVLLGFQIVMIISYLIQMFKTFVDDDSKLFYTLNLLQVLSAIGLAGMLISPFFFREILYGLPRVPGLKPGVIPVAEDGILPIELVRITLDLESDYLALINQKVNRCMEDVKPYLRHDHNLAHFAELVGVPVHHLAYFFSEEKLQTFNQFKNQWRIDHAKKLIRESAISGKSIKGIEFQSGFHNQNAFFAIFKRYEGISPASYFEQFTRK